MTRNRFLLLGAIVPGLFGLVMMVAPEMILSNHLVDTVYPATTEVTRWGGFAVFSLAWITFLSRNDPGSPALRAVISGKPRLPRPGAPHRHLRLRRRSDDDGRARHRCNHARLGRNRLRLLPDSYASPAVTLT